MHILVMGGTSFIGRAVVEHSLALGDDVTIFNRGRTGADLFPGVERRTGDRSTGDYASLGTGHWDAVVDISGYVPRHVREAADAMSGRVGRYLFISTGSVYDIERAPDEIDEDSPRLPPEHTTEEITNETYGPLKAACEDILLELFGASATIVRPGIVGGPHDPTDRFTWWVRRAIQGGTLTIDGRPEQPVQVVDVDDLASLIRRLSSTDQPGTFNAVGPVAATTVAGMANACATAAGTTLDVVTGPGATGAAPPLLLDDPASDVAFRRSAARARRVGMPATTLQATASKVLAWDRERGLPRLAAGPPLD